MSPPNFTDVMLPDLRYTIMEIFQLMARRILAHNAGESHVRWNEPDRTAESTHSESLVGRGIRRVAAGYDAIVKFSASSSEEELFFSPIGVHICHPDARVARSFIGSVN